MMRNDLLNKYNLFCEHRIAENKYRKLSVGDREDLIDFSSNDYLGLGSKDNLEAIEFAYKVAKKYGVGATGSRLLSGNNEFIMDFESQIARDKKTEKALIFNSGYQANLSVLSALCDSKVIAWQAQVFFDKSNHSSLYQAVFLAKAELIRYRHSDLDELERLLEENKDNQKPKFIVSETVFGMDGDIPDISRLVDLSIKYGALLYLDEAHATGLYGDNGYGLASEYTKSYKNMVIMGTFSKAVGSSGAYIASTGSVINYLINSANGFIYSTALSPIVVAISRFNWNKIATDEMTFNRSRLLKLADYLKAEFIKNNIKFCKSDTNIILVECENSTKCLEIRDALLSKGLIVSAIRPPTTQSPRLRVALNVIHSFEQIDRLVCELSCC